MLVIYIRGLTPLVSGIFVIRCPSIARVKSEMSFKKAIHRRFHRKYKVNNLDVILRKIGYHFISLKVHYAVRVALPAASASLNREAFRYYRINECNRNEDK